MVSTTEHKNADVDRHSSTANSSQELQEVAQGMIWPNGTPGNRPKKYNKMKRWQLLVFALTLFSHVGNNYGATLESTTQVEIERHFEVNTVSFNQVPIMRSLGVTFFTLLGPILLENFGFRKSYMFYVCLTFFGSLIINSGIWIQTFSLMLIGKAVFAGAEIVASLQFEIFSRWFDERKAPFMISVVYTLTRFVKTLGGFLIPYLAANYKSVSYLCPLEIWTTSLEQFNPGTSFLVCLAICLFGICCASLMLKIDTLLEDSYDMAKVKGSETEWQFLKVGRMFSKFPRTFWILFIGLFWGFSAINGFLMNCSKMYSLRFGYTLKDVGMVIGLYSLFTGIASMFVGCLLYKFPYYLRVLQIVAGLLTGIHIYFLLIPDSDRQIYNTVPMALLGIWNCSLIISGPPLIRKIVPPELMTEGLILFKIIEKIGLFFNPMLLGFIIDNTTWNHGYFGVSVLLIIYSSVLFIVVNYLSCTTASDSHLEKHSKLKQA